MGMDSASEAGSTPYGSPVKCSQEASSIDMDASFSNSWHSSSVASYGRRTAVHRMMRRGQL